MTLIVWGLADRHIHFMLNLRISGAIPSLPMTSCRVNWQVYSYIFFWAFPRRLIVVCRRFGTLYLFHLHRLDTSYPVYEDGTDRVFRNVGICNSDAGEIPKRIHTRFKTRRKFEIKNDSFTFTFTSQRLSLTCMIKCLSTGPTKLVTCT